MVEVITSWDHSRTRETPPKTARTHLRIQLEKEFLIQRVYVEDRRYILDQVHLDQFPLRLQLLFELVCFVDDSLILGV